MVKKIKAPKTYDPGKGRPREHLAYLNENEMAYLRSINGNNMERGPKGLPSFPPADAAGSSSKASSSGQRGAGSNYGAGSGRPGTSSSANAGVGAGGQRGAGSNTGPGSGRPGGGFSGGTATGGGYKGPSSPMGGQGTSFSRDSAVQQAAQVKDAVNAVRNSPSFRGDASFGGIKSLNVGPMGTKVSIGAPQRGGISGAIQSVQSAAQYKPSERALAAVTRGPGSVSGSIPGNTDPVAAQRSIQAITNSLNEQFGKTYTPEQVDKLVKTIAGEAAGETPFGQAAVANTMLNRISLASVDPKKYGYMGGKTIGSLLGQYDASGVRPGTQQNAPYKSSVPGTEAYRAAMNALSDASNPTGQFAETASPSVLSATHYYNPSVSDPKWGARSGRPFEAVDSHLFGNAERTAEAVREARGTAPSSPDGDFGLISSAYAADNTEGPLMAGNAPAAGQPQGSLAGAAFNAITDVFKNPQNYQMSIPEAPALVKMAPDSIKKAAMQIMGTNLGKKLASGFSQGIRSLRDYSTAPTAGKQIYDRVMTVDGQGVNVTPEQFNRLSPEDQDTLNRGLQKITFTPPEGTEPVSPNPTSPEAREKIAEPKRYSTFSGGPIGDNDRGPYRRYEPTKIQESTTGTSRKKKKTGRPQKYYDWDAGAGIPSPGDSDYTLYLKYLEEKAAAQQSV